MFIHVISAGISYAVLQINNIDWLMSLTYFVPSILNALTIQAATLCDCVLLLLWKITFLVDGS